MKHLYIIISLLYFWNLPAISQLNNIPNANQETYQSLQDEIDFTQRTTKRWKLKEFEKLESEEPLPMNGFIGSGFFTILAYALIGFLVGFIIYLSLSNIDIKDKDIKGDSEFIEDHEDIENIDALSLYDKALEEDDYRTAVRMKFIEILQHLSQVKLIKWKIDKTNRDYVRELRGTEYGSKFQKAASIYEEVWYGNTSINKEQFNALIPNLLLVMPTKVG